MVDGKFAPERIGELLEAADLALRNAYAPYSGLRVGAAVLGGSGSIYQGCNVENASFGLTICAERVAVATAVARGERTFTALAVVAEGRTDVWPCGACLQFISEFGRDIKIIARSSRGGYRMARLSSLLAEAFVFHPSGGVWP